MLIAGWDTLVNTLKDEIVQREYEGRIVPQWLKDEIAGLHPVYGNSDTVLLESLWTELECCPIDPGFSFVQPNELEAIRKERPDGPRRLEMKLSDEELLDRFHGAWTGRAAGCVLGKPVECKPRSFIKQYLQKRNDWPLTDYFSGRDLGDGDKLGCELSHREKIAYAEPDDDIHYSLIGLHVLESIGPSFAWWQVAEAWQWKLPFNALCTAESRAFLNFSVKSVNYSPIERKPWCTPHFTRSYRNPYREWIGAQIRADGWAYGCAGNPEKAAEFAYRDACWTHTANGIYGEMFCAAMIAAAFVESDPRRLVEIGLSEIPRNCKLSHAIRQSLTWIETCQDFESFVERIETTFPLFPVHVVNNALVVVMSLFYGEMDTLKTPAIAVMSGLDTDCNGATVGSIVGAAAGRRRFNEKLAAPLHDTVMPQVFGFQKITMRELAERTMAVYKRVNETK